MRRGIFQRSRADGALVQRTVRWCRGMCVTSARFALVPRDAQQSSGMCAEKGLPFETYFVNSVLTVTVRQ
jgi:hypothetical protein